jgi:hypothetical protein
MFAFFEREASTGANIKAEILVVRERSVRG